MRVERSSGPYAVSGRQNGASWWFRGLHPIGRRGRLRADRQIGARSVGGIDALIALQGVEAPAERRRRAVARGRTALDVLNALKIGLLSGEVDAGMVARLKCAVCGLKDGSGDPLLDEVLAEIELRVEVELAKMEGLRPPSRCARTAAILSIRVSNRKELRP